MQPAKTLWLSYLAHSKHSSNLSITDAIINPREVLSILKLSDVSLIIFLKYSQGHLRFWVPSIYSARSKREMGKREHIGKNLWVKTSVMLPWSTVFTITLAKVGIYNQTSSKNFNIHLFTINCKIKEYMKYIQYIYIPIFISNT